MCLVLSGLSPHSHLRRVSFHVVQFNMCHVAKFHLGTLVCIVLDPSISFVIRCIVQLWPGILQDVQSLQTSASLLFSVQTEDGIH